MNSRHIKAGIGLLLLCYAVPVVGLYVGLVNPRAVAVVSIGSSVILVITAGVLGTLLLHGEV